MYDALVAAHVICAVVGFGSVALSGVYGAMARRSGDAEETVRYFASRNRAEWLIVPVPFLGAGALAAKPSKGDFGDVWVVGGIVIWVLAAALLVHVVRPAERAIRSGVGRDRQGARLMWSSGVSDVLFVAALVLMVAQPK